MKLHLICERDVGLFSLVQSVISQLPWALAEQRIPVVFFGSRCSYYTPAGYEGRDTVWEYYFEPVIEAFPVSAVPESARARVTESPPSMNDTGYWVDEDTFACGHFGDHPDLKGKTIWIPYLWDDPDTALRRQASEIIEKYVRPRQYIREKVDAFYEQNLSGHYAIGLHVRGTDALSNREYRGHRHGSLQMDRYVDAVNTVLAKHADAKIFVATDDQRSLDTLRSVFPGRVVAYDAIRHTGGEAAGAGPTGELMPSYITQDRDRAARNGEEAVIEYLLLSMCNILIHNGAGLARTVLLAAPELEHVNTHRRPNKVRMYLALVHPRQYPRIYRGVKRRLASRLRV